MLEIVMPNNRHSVNQVFTPRRTEVNREIYVDRRALETELRRALNGSLHPIVYGESGSGKSWLYKKVLADMSAEVLSANCANATSLRLGSLTEEIRSVVTDLRPRRKVEQEEETTAEVKAVIVGGGIKNTSKYEYIDSDPLLTCFSLLRGIAEDRPAILVIDNLEMIFNDRARMEELASIITLLDDARYATHNVKLLIVGVPGEIRDYLSRTNSSVSNRVLEISEVSALTLEQVAQLVDKGFVDLLRVDFPEGVLQLWKEHIFNVTLGFAQPVQEYCEQLGYLVEDSGWIASIAHLKKADETWFKQGLSKASTVVVRLMNERETKAGRRNQVLYTLGRIPDLQFHSNDVEKILRDEFPTSTAEVTLAVGQILSELASGQEPIIKRSSKSADYEFKDARYAMALRVLLQKDETKEKVYRAHTPQF